jgi:hypothetical protein
MEMNLVQPCRALLQHRRNARMALMLQVLPLAEAEHH